MSDGYGYSYGDYSSGAGYFGCYGGESGGSYFDDWASSGYWSAGAFGSGLSTYDATYTGATGSDIQGIAETVSDGTYVSNTLYDDADTSDGLQEVTVTATRLPSNPDDSQTITIYGSRGNDSGGGLTIVTQTQPGNGYVGINFPTSAGGGESYYTSNTYAAPPFYKVPAADESVKGSAQYYNDVPANENPATVPIQASNNVVTWYLDNTSSTGHVSFSINGSVPIGVAPRNEFNAVLGFVAGNQDVAGFAPIGDDNFTPGAAISAVSINVTPAEAQAVQSYAQNLETGSVNNQIEYNAVNSSCVSAAITVATLTDVNSIGVLGSATFGPLDVLPSQFFSDLVGDVAQNQYSRFIGSYNFVVPSN